MFLRCKVRRSAGGRLDRPRQAVAVAVAVAPAAARGACWLALLLWRELQLDLFWSKRLGVSRKGTRWDQVLFVLVAYRLLAPGSEWRLHREWFQRSALADLLGEDAGVAEIHKLYRCHDRLLVHKQAVFDHLTRRWRDLFNISYDVLLYDLGARSRAVRRVGVRHCWRVSIRPRPQRPSIAVEPCRRWRSPSDKTRLGPLP